MFISPSGDIIYPEATRSRKPSLNTFPQAQSQAIEVALELSQSPGLIGQSINIDVQLADRVSLTSSARLEVNGVIISLAILLDGDEARPQSTSVEANPNTRITQDLTSGKWINLSAASADRQAGSPQSSQLNKLENSIEFRTLNVNQNQDEILRQDPLVLDLNGDGITTTGVNNGVQFDIDGDGTTEKVSMVNGDNMLLAIDKNGNGVIDNGKELFGDQNGAANGFEELRKYDENNDGIINSNDAVFNKLRLLSINQIGQQSIQNISQQNIKQINLDYLQSQTYLDSDQITNSDIVSQKGTFEFYNGKSAQAADLLLSFKKQIE